jgi:hypothetical protein
MVIARSGSIRADASVSASHRRAALTPTAWSPLAELPMAVWIRQGRWLGALGRASGWWIGDWIRYGNARYGERYEAAARLTGYDVHSLRNMAYVAAHFEIPRRRAGLSFSHHAELACLPPEEQELWLDRVEAGDLSVRTLRIRLRETRDRVASRAALAEPSRPGAEHSALIGRPIRRAMAEVTCPECGHHFAPRAEALDR